MRLWPACTATIVAMPPAGNRGENNQSRSKHHVEQEVTSLLRHRGAVLPRRRRRRWPSPSSAIPRPTRAAPPRSRPMRQRTPRRTRSCSTPTRPSAARPWWSFPAKSRATTPASCRSSAPTTSPTSASWNCRRPTSPCSNAPIWATCCRRSRWPTTWATRRPRARPCRWASSRRRKWIVKFDILKAEQIAENKKGFDGRAVGGLMSMLGGSWAAAPRAT